MLNAVLDRLGVDRVILVGHSWGGLLALTFALDYSHRVAGLVVIAPPTHPWLGQTTWLSWFLRSPCSAGYLPTHMTGPGSVSVSILVPLTAGFYTVW